jgi:hypothetical protein
MFAKDPVLILVITSGIIMFSTFPTILYMIKLWTLVCLFWEYSQGISINI